FSVPSAAAVPPPSGWVTNVQQVPVQFTRLPATVAQSRVTGWFGVSPATETATFVATAPLARSRETVASAFGEKVSADIVVRAETVGFTATGQSIRVF